MLLFSSVPPFALQINWIKKIDQDCFRLDFRNPDRMEIQNTNMFSIMEFLVMCTCLLAHPGEFITLKKNRRENDSAPVLTAISGREMFARL